jgi:hypothetical protein
MNAHATLIADPARDPYDPVPETVARARALAQGQLKLLERLSEAGLRVVLAIEAEAERRAGMAGAGADEPAENPAPSDAPAAPMGAGVSLQGLAMAYARAARAVRMTLALQSRVLRDLEAVERQAACSAPFEAGQRASARAERKRRIARILTRVIDAAAPDDAPEAIEALAAEASERLADEDICGDALTRPMGEIIARICADLGLDPDWSAFAQEAWAQAEAVMGDPRSPFAGLAPGGEWDRMGRPGCEGKAAPSPCPIMGDSS